MKVSGVLIRLLSRGAPPHIRSSSLIAVLRAVNWIGASTQGEDRKMRPLPEAIVCLLMILARDVSAQTKAHFEVASIKPAAPGALGMFIRPDPGGGVTITNMTLKEMIVHAWRVQPFQISGGPAWLDSVHYDVIAKPETRTTPLEIPVMLQALLKDRFQLAIRRQTRELPIYALVLARKDGKLAPGMKESKEGSCTPP